MAGIRTPLEDLDLVELHDAFTISDLQTYGDIGLRPYGQEQDYIESGDAYYINPNTRKPGKCPSNLSGGLIGTMHAVGATGIFQAAECLWQLQQKYDQFHGAPALWKKWGKEKPKDWQSLQIPATAKQALWVSHAGVGSHVTVGILRKAW
jgi:acetyl-CoA C-acetyltransferase